MPFVLLIQALLSTVLWGPVRATTIFSLPPHELFTAESLGGVAETVEAKQTSTVPPDQDPETSETDPATDGGSRASSQIVVTTPATSFFNGADGEGNKNLPESAAATTVGSKQRMILEMSTSANKGQTFLGVGGSGAENHSRIFMPLAEANRSVAFGDHLAPAFSNVSKENSTNTERHPFCKIPPAGGQKKQQDVPSFARQKGELRFLADIGEAVTLERGDSRSKTDIDKSLFLGQTEERTGSHAFFCPRGEKGEAGEPGPLGHQGLKGDKGSQGESGAKSDPGQKGDPGEKGGKGIAGRKGVKGSSGPQGVQGTPGIKGDPGIQGKLGVPGKQGPTGLPGQKGEKGQKGDCRAVEPTAFSAALQKRRSFPLPGSPVRFENIFLNENEAYHDKSGIFTATAEGIYFFSYHLSVSRKPLRAALFHNGQRILQVSGGRQPPPQGISQVSGSVLVHLSEDDEVWLQILNASQNGLVADETTDSVFLGFLLYPD